MEDGYAQVLPANYPPRFLSFSTSDACWRTKAMPGLGTDLNLQPPESGQIYPIYWDGVAEFDGLAHELDYDMVCDDGIQDDEDEADGVQGDGAAYGVHVS
ncbi:hypothetical protein SORBI_3004G127766 [Sorghum bicolor]|uniref:Uncharacterized protein n=1 Tax=Sorghum bicolor TaxID=4558 RepID=A0A1Z5RM46_SORBI|nr:hypothetical protein SORBI_3004G127766 [Sorghum bicolor]